MHGTCICLFGSFFVIGMGFYWSDSGLALPCNFLDSHGVMGFNYRLSFGLSKGFGTR